MSGVFKAKTDGLMIAVFAAGIGAAATIGATLMTHVFDVESKRCDHSNNRFEKIDDMVERVAKLRKLNDFINDKSNVDCDYYAQARNDAMALRRQIREYPSGTGVESPVPAFPSARVAEALATRPEGRSVVAPPPVSPVVAETSPPSTSFNGLAPDVPVFKKAPPVVVAQPEPPPLVVTPLPRFSDPAVPFEGGLGDSLIFKRYADYTLLPRQDTTTTYKIRRGSLTVTIDGQPYFACKKGNQFRLYWRNMPAFTAKSDERSTELELVNLEAGKHLGTSDCAAVLG